MCTVHTDSSTCKWHATPHRTFFLKLEIGLFTCHCLSHPTRTNHKLHGFGKVCGQSTKSSHPKLTSVHLQCVQCVWRCPGPILDDTGVIASGSARSSRLSRFTDGCLVVCDGAGRAGICWDGTSRRCSDQSLLCVLFEPVRKQVQATKRVQNTQNTRGRRRQQKTEENSNFKIGLLHPSSSYF